MMTTSLVLLTLSVVMTTLPLMHTLTSMLKLPLDSGTHRRHLWRARRTPMTTPMTQKQVCQRPLMRKKMMLTL